MANKLPTWLSDSKIATDVQQEIGDALVALRKKTVTKVQEGVLAQLQAACEGNEQRKVKKLLGQLQEFVRGEVEDTAEEIIDDAETEKFPKLPGKHPELTQEMANKFIIVCGGSLKGKSRDMQLHTIEITQGRERKKYQDKARLLIIRVGKNVFNSASASSKSIRYITLIAEGKVHKEAVQIVNRESESELPSLPSKSPELTEEMARKFIAACGGTLKGKSADNQSHIIEVRQGKTRINYQDKANLLINRVGIAVFNSHGAASKSIRYITLIAEGKVHKEAVQIVNRESESELPSLPSKSPELTEEMARKFIAACGGTLKGKTKDTEPHIIEVIVGKKKNQYQITIQSFLQKIGRALFSNRGEYSKSTRYVELIAEGKSHIESMQIIHSQAENALQILPSRHPELTEEMARKFIAACGGTLKGKIKDTEVHTIEIGEQNERKGYQDKATSFIDRVAQAIFTGSNTCKKAVRYIELIAEGKNHEEAINLIQLSTFSVLPGKHPELTTEMAHKFIAVCGGTLRGKTEDMTERIIDISNETDGRKYRDTACALLYRVSYNVFNGQKKLLQPIRYIELIAKGKNHDEAKRIAEMDDTEFADQTAEDELAELAQYSLEEAMALFQEDPAKLRIYLTYVHPELSPEDVDRLVMRSFRGLRCGGIEKSEGRYLAWERTLELPRLTKVIPRSTKQPTTTINGTAPQGATHMFIAGTFTRRVRVETDGTFSIVVPLKVGETNEIRLMALDTDGKKRSETLHHSVEQTGKPDDIDALVRLLCEMGETALSEVQQDKGRLAHLTRCLERSLIKKFSRSFKDGETYIKGLQKSASSRIMKSILHAILTRFQEINESDMPGIAEDKLMFFQKYCAMEIRRRIEEGLPGVILANDPGTGKTRTVLAATSAFRTTIVTPNAVVPAWREESGRVQEDPDLLVLHGASHTVRKEQLRTKERLRHVVTNREFIRKTDDQERFVLLNRAEEGEKRVVVEDEAHSRHNDQSEQTKGVSKLEADFRILVTATPAKNPETFRKMMAVLYPNDQRFQNPTAFARAFPSDDPQALKALNLLKDDVTIRFRKDDAMETVDPRISLAQQRHRLPKKEHISPDTLGGFELSMDQARAIYEIFLDWEHWCRDFGHYVPEDDEDVRTGEGFAKRHALRQTANNPRYINSDAEDEKAATMRKIIDRCLEEGRRPLIFCAYEAQAQKYAAMFADLCPALYTGSTNERGERKDGRGRAIRYLRSRTDSAESDWVLDADGYPIPDTEGADADSETMSALEYERLTFQNANDRQLAIATFDAGAVGTTFTGAKALIFDDLPTDIIQLIQAEDRIHRIDPDRLTHATVQYYTLESRYPQAFLDELKNRWLVRENGGYREFMTEEEAHQFAGQLAEEREVDPDTIPVVNAYQQFFAQGTYDQAHGRNLRVQGTMFSLINDGIADNSVLKEGQDAFNGLETE